VRGGAEIDARLQNFKLGVDEMNKGAMQRTDKGSGYFGQMGVCIIEVDGAAYIKPTDQPVIGSREHHEWPSDGRASVCHLPARFSGEVQHAMFVIFVHGLDLTLT
jgi:hypothetical protein